MIGLPKTQAISRASGLGNMPSMVLVYQAVFTIVSTFLWKNVHVLMALDVECFHILILLDYLVILWGITW